MRHILIIGVFFLATIAFGADKEPPFPAACQESCVTPFGTKLGVTPDGVEAHSNCRPQCVFEKPSYVDDAFAGIEWQCVEFARRWLLARKGLTFGSIDVAADLWNKVDHLEDVKTKRVVPLRKRENGSSTLPKPGDLLVYGREYLETGHVAVVLKVDGKKRKVYVGEENFRNEKWPGAYARAIPFVKQGAGYWVLDAYLLGWETY